MPFLMGRVNKVRRQLRGTDTEITTIAALRGACVTFAKGINGVQYGARPVPMDDTDLGTIEARAIEWFDALTAALGPVLEDRENNVTASPAVLAALGAVGHPLSINEDAAGKKWPRHESLLVIWKVVVWSRGKAWEGIAGKFTPKGTFTLGGPKETAHAIYAALTNLSSDGYTRIRPEVAAAA